MRAIAIALLAALPAAAQNADLPVEQTKKNIKTLTGLPSSQLIPVMAFMANSLGVTCAHCHAKEYDSDEKPAKQTARQHIAMQRAINEQQFGGKLTVTCNTCHQGHATPRATPDVANAAWNATPTATSPQFVPAEEALARLPQPAANATKRVIRGTVERFNGRDPAKSAPFTVTFDGSNAKYETDLSHPPEATRALALFKIERTRPEQVHGERWLVTNEVVRRHRETPTPLGILPEEIEYSDFRDTPTGRLPFRTQWLRADYRVTYTVTEAPAPDRQ